MTSRYHKILSVASRNAEKSDQTFQHGAVITQGSKVLEEGYNKGNRTKILDHVFTCAHAEMDVLNKFINGYLIPKYGRNFTKHTNKYSVWVVRLNKQDKTRFTDSKPCHYCSTLLKKYGFSKVYFTTNNNMLQVQKVCDLVSDHKSNCQLKSEQVDTSLKLRLL